MNATLPILFFDDRLFAPTVTGESMSDCHFLPLISAYHDGELSDQRAAEVKDHLTYCGDCRTELEELRALSASMATIELPRMPVTSRLRLKKQASLFAVAGRVRFVRALTAIAASVFIVAGSMLAFQQVRPGGTPTDGVEKPILHPATNPGEKADETVIWNQNGTTTPHKQSDR